MKLKIPLYIKILIGMALGLIWGVVAVEFNFSEATSAWLVPFGTIFMRLLKCVAIPLVFVSLVVGVSNIGSISSLSKMGLRTFGIYIITTVLAICLGLTLVLSIGPGKGMNTENVAQMQQTYHSTVASRASEAVDVGAVSPLQWLVDIVPDNMIQAVGSNANMLQVIFIALICGVALLSIPSEKAAPFLSVVESVNAMILRVIDYIMMFAPLGVLALMAGMVVDNAGNLDVLGALGLYALTVALGLALMILLVYPLIIRLFSDMPVGRFMKSMIPVQLLALTTSSSAATLPLTMETVQDKLGISNRIASFVLPVGVTINMDGTSLYQAVAVVFIAQVLGIELGWVELLTIVATTT
ncbi:MAG: dicarboxylate/amino acid:cation symporter, partial [Mucinivorans sp.]